MAAVFVLVAPTPKQIERQAERDPFCSSRATHLQPCRFHYSAVIVDILCFHLELLWFNVSSQPQTGRNSPHAHDHPPHRPHQPIPLHYFASILPVFLCVCVESERGTPSSLLGFPLSLCPMQFSIAFYT